MVWGQSFKQEVKDKHDVLNAEMRTVHPCLILLVSFKTCYLSH